MNFFSFPPFANDFPRFFIRLIPPLFVSSLSHSALDINPGVLSIFLFHTFFPPSQTLPESFCSSVVVLVAKSGERGGGERRKKEQNVKPHILGVANDAGVCSSSRRSGEKKSTLALSRVCVFVSFFSTPPTNEVSSRRLVYTHVRFMLFMLSWMMMLLCWALSFSLRISTELRSPFAHMLCPQSGGKESKNFEKSCGFFWKRKKSISATNTNEFFSLCLLLTSPRFAVRRIFFISSFCSFFTSHTVSSEGFHRPLEGRGVYDSRVSVSSQAVEDSRSKGRHHVLRVRKKYNI